MPKIFICYARIRKNNCRAKTNRGMAAVAVGGSLRSAVSVGLGPVAIRVAPSMRYVGVWLPCSRTCRMPCLTHRWLSCPPAVAWPPAGRAGSVAMNHGGGHKGDCVCLLCQTAHKMVRMSVSCGVGLGLRIFIQFKICREYIFSYLCKGLPSAGNQWASSHCGCLHRHDII